MISGGGKLLDTMLIKNFLIFYATTTKGKIGDQPTLIGHLHQSTGKSSSNEEQSSALSGLPGTLAIPQHRSSARAYDVLSMRILPDK